MPICSLTDKLRGRYALTFRNHVHARTRHPFSRYVHRTFTELLRKYALAFMHKPTLVLHSIAKFDSEDECARCRMCMHRHPFSLRVCTMAMRFAPWHRGAPDHGACLAWQLPRAHSPMPTHNWQPQQPPSPHPSPLMGFWQPHRPPLKRFAVEGADVTDGRQRLRHLSSRPGASLPAYS